MISVTVLVVLKQRSQGVPVSEIDDVEHKIEFSVPNVVKCIADPVMLAFFASRRHGYMQPGCLPGTGDYGVGL